jgi:hypothetical protein
MDIRTGFVAHVVRSARRLGVIVIPALVIAVAALAGVVIGDFLAPASEPIIVAPFRWIPS